MRISLISDVHFSKYSSILRSRGEKYSTRLEKLIQGLNWSEEWAKQNNCDACFCLGDFFDKPELDAEELSALSEIKWNGLPHYFLVGNHEMASSDLSINSANLFDLMPNAKVIDKPCYVYENIFCLPYILDSNRKNLKEYIQKDSCSLILSHNDIKGIQMGSFISESGFTLDEINDCCELFINGHLHNGLKIGQNAFNIGNFCGQNFSEDAFKYDHVMWIIDTDANKIQIYNNPYALNFFKLDFSEKLDVQTFDFTKLKNNSVCSIKCKEEDYKFLQENFNRYTDNKILASKFIIEHNTIVNDEEVHQIASDDHLKQFEMYVKEHIASDSITIEELQEVLYK